MQTVITGNNNIASDQNGAKIEASSADDGSADRGSGSSSTGESGFSSEEEEGEEESEGEEEEEGEGLVDLEDLGALLSKAKKKPVKTSTEPKVKLNI